MPTHSIHASATYILPGNDLLIDVILLHIPPSHLKQILSPLLLLTLLSSRPPADVSFGHGGVAILARVFLLLRMAHVGGELVSGAVCRAHIARICSDAAAAPVVPIAPVVVYASRSYCPSRGGIVEVVEEPLRVIAQVSACAKLETNKLCTLHVSNEVSLLVQSKDQDDMCTTCYRSGISLCMCKNRMDG